MVPNPPGRGIVARLSDSLRSAADLLSGRRYLLAVGVVALGLVYYVLIVLVPASLPPTPVPPPPTAAPTLAATSTEVPPSQTATPTATDTPSPAATGTPTTTGTPTLTATSTPTATQTAVPTVAFFRTFDYQPLAIMIENHPDARPQTGLNEADVVYEAVAEGGITRFLAVYANGRPNVVVGPVRSARHYYVYWAQEYNAIYVHIGASPQGYNAVNATGITTIDAIYGEGGDAFWRIAERLAPHNLYASTKALWSWVKSGGKGQLAGLQFKADSPQTGASQLAVTYPDGYRVGYEYVPTTNSYLRYMDRVPHVDASDGVQYSPKNVIVQVMAAWLIRGDDKGRMDMQVVGGGKAYIFTDGRAIKGSWSKASLHDVTHFYDADGKPVLLNAGQTWIEVLPTEGSVSYQ